MTDERKALVAAGYDAIASRYLDWSSRASDPARVRMLNEFIARLPPGAQVLDTGGEPAGWGGAVLAGRSANPGRPARP